MSRKPLVELPARQLEKLRELHQGGEWGPNAMAPSMSEIEAFVHFRGLCGEHQVRRLIEAGVIVRHADGREELTTLGKQEYARLREKNRPR